MLSERGLDAALEALAGRAPLPVRVEATIGEGLSEPVELAVFFVVSEALTNVAKYARASQATVRATRRNGRVLVEVSDDALAAPIPRRAPV